MPSPAEIIVDLAEQALKKAAKPQYADTWIPLTSSNLNAFYWDSESTDLTIEFHGGRRYRYFRIPDSMVEGLLRAGSPGEWWHANLRGAPFERL